MLPMDWLSSPLGERWTLVLLHFLWQGLCISLAAAGTLRLIHTRSSAVRYGLLLGAIGLQIAAPLVTFVVIDPRVRAASNESSSIAELRSASDMLSGNARLQIPFTEVPDDRGSPSPIVFEAPLTVGADIPFEGLDRPTEREFTAATDAAPQEVASEAPATATWYFAVQPVVLLIWLAGCLLFAVRLVIGLVRTLLLRRGRLPVSSDLLQRSTELAKAIGFRRCPRLLLSKRVRDAVVVGYLRPLILLPATWVTDLPMDVLDAVIAHELAHIRRFDLWIILLQRVTETVFFYHPAVWWLSWRLSCERELCCDELAAAAIGSGRRYAVALEHVAHRLRGLEAPRRLDYSLTPTLGGRKMELLHRVRHALTLDDANADSRKPRASRLPHGLALFIVPMVFVASAWACLEHSPQASDVSTDIDRIAAAPASADNSSISAAQSDALDDTSPESPDQSPSVQLAAESFTLNWTEPAPGEFVAKDVQIATARDGRQVLKCGPGHVVLGDIRCYFQCMEAAADAPISMTRGPAPRWSRWRATRGQLVDRRNGHTMILAQSLDFQFDADGETPRAIFASGNVVVDRQEPDGARSAFTADELRMKLAPNDPAIEIDPQSDSIRRMSQEPGHDINFKLWSNQNHNRSARAIVWIEPEEDADQSRDDDASTADDRKGAMGLLVDPSGLVLTARSDLSSGGNGRVSLTDGRSFDARQVAEHERSGLRLLQLLAPGPIEGAIDIQKLGQPNVYIGKGEMALVWLASAADQFTVRPGRMRAYIPILLSTGRRQYTSLWALDCPMTLAESGGPVFNERGQLAGLSLPIETLGKPQTNVLPIDQVAAALAAMRATLEFEAEEAESPDSTPQAAPPAAPALDAATESQSAVKPTRSQIAPAGIYFVDDVQFFPALPERIAAKNDLDEEAAIEVALQAWCRGINEPVHYTFNRYIYDATFLTERRAVGQIWRESPTKWRLDIDPVKADRLPAPNAQGQRLNPRKTGPNGQPFTVVTDEAARYLQLHNQVAYIDATKSSVYAADPKSKSLRSALNDMAAVDPGSGWWPTLFPHLKFHFFGSLPETNPALVDVPRNPAAIRERFEVTAGAMPAPNRHAGDPGKPMHLVLVPKQPQLAREFSRLELLVDRSSGRTAALKIMDPSGQLETVYVFKTSDQPGEVGPQISVKQARLNAAIPRYYPVYKAVDYSNSAAVWSVRNRQPPTDYLAAARETLAANGNTAAISLDSQDSQWVLTGQVPSQADADRLLELVRSQRRPGKVRAVVSELVIVDEGDRAPAGRPADPQESAEVAPEALIYKALAAKVDLEFIDTPLGEALKSISERYLDGRLTIDESVLRGDAGVSLRMPVSLVLSGVSARSALKLLLEDKDLGWIMEEDQLVVTSRWAVERKCIPRVYPVADLIVPIVNPEGAVANDARQVVADPEVLVEFITSVIRPEELDVRGGRSTVKFRATTLSLAINAPQRVHEEVADCLQQLRRLKFGPNEPAGNAREGDVALQMVQQPAIAAEGVRQLADALHAEAVSEETRRIRLRLKVATSVEFQQVPLSKVFETISGQHGLNVVVDLGGLSECGVARDALVTLHLSDVPLRTVLNCLLAPHDLAWVVDDEVLKITSRARAEGVTVRTYDLSSLVEEGEEPAVLLRRYANLLETTIAPDSWDEAGGIGNVSAHVGTGSLVVRQTANVHRELEQVLGNLGRLHAGEAVVNPPLDAEPEAERGARERLLSRRGSVELRDVALSELPKAIGSLADGKLWVDERGVLEAGLDMDARVHLSAADITLGDTLSQLTTPLGLGYCVQDGLIVITSPERCGGALSSRVYALPRTWIDELQAGTSTSKGLLDRLRRGSEQRFWSDQGGSGHIALDGRTNSVVVYQTEARHRKIERVLAEQASR